MAPAKDITPEFLNNLKDFTVSSMLWCIKESETEVTRIYNILNTLMADSTRRTNMSKEVMKSVQEVQEMVKLLLQKKQGKEDLSTLIKTLENHNKNQNEIHKLTDPIIEALQFQDRLRQNLENLGKVINAWVINRKEFAQESDPTKASIAMGEALLKCTTSQEERSLIRNVIKGLPEEVKTESALFF